MCGSKYPFSYHTDGFAKTGVVSSVFITGIFLKAVKTVEMFGKGDLYYFWECTISLVVLSPLQGGVCQSHSPDMQLEIAEARLCAIETRLGTIRLDSTMPIL